MPLMPSPWMTDTDRGAIAHRVAEGGTVCGQALSASVLPFDPTTGFTTEVDPHQGEYLHRAACVECVGN